jgi:8-oxo-dGTP pyrophosphatase MutT (NUDIX family)
MLRRRMSQPQPLTPRLERLRRRLASHPPRYDEEGDELIWAAVAVVLAAESESLLLIRRAERTGDPWSGHMALPGGRRDAPDEDLVATAMREVVEEVGLQLGPSHLMGGLDDVVPRTPVLPPIAVRPFVFLLPDPPPLVLNPEVAAAEWVPIDRLLAAGTHRPIRLEIRGESREMPAYHLETGVVWGMTERVVSGLLSHLR